MIAAIRGTVEGKTLDSALVTVGGGVTLRVLMPLNALARLTVGTAVHLQAVEALTNLGYPVAHASAAVRSVPEDQAGSLEDLIMRSLRNLASE
jgi:Holliday junction resolvasome RuvABC DNA-binding subunit